RCERHAELFQELPDVADFELWCADVRERDELVRESPQVLELFENARFRPAPRAGVRRQPPLSFLDQLPDLQMSSRERRAHLVRMPARGLLPRGQMLQRSR